MKVIKFVKAFVFQKYFNLICHKYYLNNEGKRKISANNFTFEDRNKLNQYYLFNFDVQGSETFQHPILQWDHYLQTLSP